MQFEKGAEIKLRFRLGQHKGRPQWWARKNDEMFVVQSGSVILPDQNHEEWLCRMEFCSNKTIFVQPLQRCGLKTLLQFQAMRKVDDSGDYIGSILPRPGGERSILFILDPEADAIMIKHPWECEVTQEWDSEDGFCVKTVWPIKERPAAKRIQPRHRRLAATV